MNLPIFMRHIQYPYIKWIAYINPNDEIEYTLINENTKEGKQEIIDKNKLVKILNDLKDEWEICKIPDINLISDGKLINTIKLN